MNQYPLYYNFLKPDKEEDYQQLTNLCSIVTSNNPPSFFIQTCWSLKSRDFLAWNIIALCFSDILVCCSAKFMAFFNRHTLIEGLNSLIPKIAD